MSITGLGEVADLIKTGINAAFPDKTEIEKAQMASTLVVVQGQLLINQAEAANPSTFTSGWRPFVGWVCGLGFATEFVIGPVGEWASGLIGHPVKFPPMDIATMMPLLFGMLGLGGFRTVEKMNGVASK